MRLLKLTAPPILGALLLAGCASGPTIRSNEDPAANFSQYRTYGFSPALENADFGYQSLLTKYLKDAVARQMDVRGYRQSDDPDLLVNFYVNTKEKIKATTTPTAGGYYGYRGSYYGGWGGYQTNVTQYTQGTLTIDLVDAKRKQLVWEGNAVGRVRQSTLDDVEGAVNRVVPQIFEKYPHRAGS